MGTAYGMLAAVLLLLLLPRLLLSLAALVWLRASGSLPLLLRLLSLAALVWLRESGSLPLLLRVLSRAARLWLLADAGGCTRGAVTAPDRCVMLPRGAAMLLWENTHTQQDKNGEGKLERGRAQ